MAQENTASSLDPLPEGQGADGATGAGAPAAESTHGNEASGLHTMAASDSGEHAGAGPLAGGIADVAVLGNIPVKLSMEIGRTSITIAELLSLGKGSVVELQRMADEPLDILVNGTLVAHGEAVVVGERFGIRLTDVISAKERLGKVV